MTGDRHEPHPPHPPTRRRLGRAGWRGAGGRRGRASSSRVAAATGPAVVAPALGTAGAHTTLAPGLGQAPAAAARAGRRAGTGVSGPRPYRGDWRPARLADRRAALRIRP